MKRACALLLVGVAGCSMITMKDPPSTTATISQDPDCTTSKAAPVADLGLGITSMFTGFVLLLGAAIVNAVDSGNEADDLAIAGVIGLGGGIGFTVSGVSGFRKARMCRAAEEQYNFSRSPMFAPPPVYQQPPPQVPLGGPGAERGVCRLPPAPPCDPGLTCASGYCVVLAPGQ